MLWIMSLPEELSNRFDAELKILDEEETMADSLSPTLRRVADRERKEGKDEGMIEGQKEGIVTSILTILNTRFGDYPEELEIRLRQIKSHETLSDILTNAITTSTIAEFERSLDK